MRSLLYLETIVPFYEDIAKWASDVCIILEDQKYWLKRSVNNLSFNIRDTGCEVITLDGSFLDKFATPRSHRLIEELVANKVVICEESYVIPSYSNYTASYVRNYYLELASQETIHDIHAYSAQMAHNSILVSEGYFSMSTTEKLFMVALQGKFMCFSSDIPKASYEFFQNELHKFLADTQSAHDSDIYYLEEELMDWCYSVGVVHTEELDESNFYADYE